MRRCAPAAVPTSKWRTPEDAGTYGLIGPNAILQLVPVLEQAGGPDLARAVLTGAGVYALPDGEAMVPEAEAARVHAALRAQVPDLAPALAWAAGTRTADYILAHRIPMPAQQILKLLPPFLAAPVLSRAITAHAWTFAGSGRFTAVTPWQFELDDNPLIRGVTSDAPVCDWHRAVFQRLYKTLVARNVRCREVTCKAAGDPCCRFVLDRG